MIYTNIRRAVSNLYNTNVKIQSELTTYYIKYLTAAVENSCWYYTWKLYICNGYRHEFDKHLELHTIWSDIHIEELKHFLIPQSNIYTFTSNLNHHKYITKKTARLIRGYKYFISQYFDIPILSESWILK